jgi:glutamate--cysteine ligase
MSGPSAASSEPIRHRQQLIDSLASGSKPKSAWRIGTEHEKFGFRLDDLRPLPWDGPNKASKRCCEGLIALRLGSRVERERQADRTSQATAPRSRWNRRVSSNFPAHRWKPFTQTCCRNRLSPERGEDAWRKNMGVGFLGMGFQPKWPRDQMPWMPKGRYQIMRDYMPKRGNLGLDMMTRTCTVQVNLDFASEADMVKKFRVSLALQPIATALFADSPFTEGKPNGYQSYRSHIWTDTDPDRTGMLDFVFADGFGFERYVDYLLDVPMYFVYRDGRYLDASGQSFRDFLAGKLEPVYPDHADPRIKRLGRSHDHGLPRSASEKVPGNARRRWRPLESPLRALPAFWVGLLYDQTRRWTPPGIWSRTSAMEERHALRDGVPKHAPEAPLPQRQPARYRHRSLEDLGRRPAPARTSQWRRSGREHFPDAAD